MPTHQECKELTDRYGMCYMLTYPSWISTLCIDRPYSSHLEHEHVINVILIHSYISSFFLNYSLPSWDKLCNIVHYKISSKWFNKSFIFHRFVNNVKQMITPITSPKNADLSKVRVGKRKYYWILWKRHLGRQDILLSPHN